MLSFFFLNLNNIFLFLLASFNIIFLFLLPSLNIIIIIFLFNYLPLTLPFCSCFLFSLVHLFSLFFLYSLIYSSLLPQILSLSPSFFSSSHTIPVVFSSLFLLYSFSLFHSYYLSLPLLLLSFLICPIYSPPPSSAISLVIYILVLIYSLFSFLYLAYSHSSFSYFYAIFIILLSPFLPCPPLLALSSFRIRFSLYFFLSLSSYIQSLWSTFLSPMFI